MSKISIFPATQRGHADYGWLKTYHSFSFANYYNPSNMNFGALRVLNDDYIAAGMGFGSHPHNNMEIITIPFSGALSHKDSMGNASTIYAGDVQVMSAGTGIMHSEFNHDLNNEVTLFQIWIIPKTQNVEPRYQQITLDKTAPKNIWQQLVSPNANEEGVWIHQNAWIKMATLDLNQPIIYEKNIMENGVFIIVINGSIEIENTLLKAKDAIGIEEINNISILSKSANSKILSIEVPMVF